MSGGGREFSQMKAFRPPGPFGFGVPSVQTLLAMHPTFHAGARIWVPWSGTPGRHGSPQWGMGVSGISA